MRRTSAFQPLVVDGLEDRRLLSHLGAASAAAAVHQQASPSAQAIATTQVSDAYSAFVTNFSEAVNVDLYAPNVSGYGSNAPFFSQQLGQELSTLTKSVMKSLNSEPAGSHAVIQIRKAINGSSSSSLRSRLTALTQSSLEVGSAISTYEGTAIKEIQQNYLHVKKEVLAALPAAATTSSPTTT
jgi:hypothetical protein